MPPVPPYQVCVAFLLRTRPDGRAEVLLGRKKTGLGSGNIVGLGGKLEPGESALQAIVREIEEEAGLIVDPADLTEMGLMRFAFPFRQSWSQDSTVFVAERWEGEPQESDEVAPDWYALDALPLDGMWDDAKLWLPQVLAGRPTAGDFEFGEDCKTVSRFALHEPSDLREHEEPHHHG
jgi:8-oxo-dGTP diphosphatase